jgi:hypothetical protein
MRTRTFEADYSVCLADVVAALNAEYESLQD